MHPYESPSLDSFMTHQSPKDLYVFYDQLIDIVAAKMTILENVCIAKARRFKENTEYHSRL